MEQAKKWLQDSINFDFEYVKYIPITPSASWTKLGLLFEKVTTVRQSILAREANALFDRGPTRDKVNHAMLVKELCEKILDMMTEFRVPWVGVVRPWLWGFIEAYHKYLRTQHSKASHRLRKKEKYVKIKEEFGWDSYLPPDIEKKGTGEDGEEEKEEDGDGGEPAEAERKKHGLVAQESAAGGSLRLLGNDFIPTPKPRMNESNQCASFTPSKRADIETVVLEKRILLEELKLAKIEQRQVLEELKLSKLELERAKVREGFRKRFSSSESNSSSFNDNMEATSSSHSLGKRKHRG